MTNSPVMQPPPQAKLARLDWLKIQYQSTARTPAALFLSAWHGWTINYIEVKEISKSAHFMFYDNPVETFDAIGEFVSST